MNRCRHVVEENERVLKAGNALVDGHLELIGPLFAASHESLRDLYEVSSVELDALVEIATAVSGVVGARMTGGGFGGAAIALVAAEHVQAVADAATRAFAASGFADPTVFTVVPSAGAGRDD
jgi:galactokinase